MKLLDLYLGKLPTKAIEKDLFYLRPLDKVPDNPAAPWFSNAQIGENKLSKMVKEMFKQVGIDDKTNHSLRATGATCLYSANVPEKIIQQRTGHQSLKCLRTYKHTSDEQHLAVSTILTDPSNVVYDQTVTNVEKVTNVKVSQSSPTFSSLFGTTSNCVIDVNFGSSHVN